MLDLGKLHEGQFMDVSAFWCLDELAQVKGAVRGDFECEAGDCFVVAIVVICSNKALTDLIVASARFNLDRFSSQPLKFLERDVEVGMGEYPVKLCGVCLRSTAEQGKGKGGCQ